MGLRFKITDNKGKTSFVEKKQPLVRPRSKSVNDEEKEEKKEELVLNEKEIKVLKALAEKSEDLLALLVKKGVAEEEAEPGKAADSDEEEEIEVEEEEVETGDEEVVELPDEEEADGEDEVTEDAAFCEEDEDLEEVREKETHDSKKSFGSIETKKSVSDSLIDDQEEINLAWSQRRKHV